MGSSVNKRQVLVNKKRFTFYVWIGLAFLLLSVLGELSHGVDTFPVRALNDAWMMVFIVALNYFFYEYTWPRLSSKRVGWSILLLLGQLVLLLLCLCIWRGIGMATHIYTSFAKTTGRRDEIGEEFGADIFSLILFGIIRHIAGHIRLRQDAQQLRIEKQAAELNYLKSQTNPHFLFNTLNNIYSLARDKSDLAPESILRLSKILRFMLYETAGDYIAIEQELKIISDYIALERLRYDETLRVNFNYDIEDMKQAMPSLLLIPLVENAFKHGVSETRDRPFVDIHLSVKKRQLAFFVKNSTEESVIDRGSVMDRGSVTDRASAATHGVKENIGLSNLRRQLELQYTDYSLSVEPGEYVFTAILKINLASHV